MSRADADAMAYFQALQEVKDTGSVQTPGLGYRTSDFPTEVRNYYSNGGDGGNGGNGTVTTVTTTRR